MQDHFSGCLQLLLAMPSTSAPMVAWSGRMPSHSFPTSKWMTWPSCTPPCHPMRLSSPDCEPPTCLGRDREDYAEPCWFWVHKSFALLMTCSCTTATGMSCHSWQPCRDSTRPTSWANWTCWRLDPPFPPQACVSACKVRSSCFTSLVQPTLTSVSLIVGGLSIVVWGMPRLASLPFRCPTMVPRHFPVIPWLGTMPTV